MGVFTVGVPQKKKDLFLTDCKIKEEVGFVFIFHYYSFNGLLYVNK
jgi:hypothetical protein